MRVLGKDVGEGRLHLRIDTLDDLWTLRNLIRRGDRVIADTVRTADIQGDRVRDTKPEKRAVRLGVRAETVEWHDFDDHLRVLGPIETGPQDHGRHHTLALRGDGSDVVIEKRRPLAGWELRLVDAAVAETHRPQVLLVAIDDTEAQFATLTSYGLRIMGSLPSGIQGKRHAGAEASKEAFYQEAAKSLKAFRPDPAVPCVVVGPGWWKDEFVAHLAKPGSAAAGQGRNLTLEPTAHGGRTGLQEALRRGVVSRIAQAHRVEEETTLVEDVFERIGRGDRTVAYGPAEVASAVHAGAVDTLLASDQVVRAGDHDAVLHAAEQARAAVRIVSSGHEAGERLARMGGLAALLRFAFPA